MNGEQLRAMQAPLKQSYRDAPQSALVTLEASGDLGGEALTCSVRTGRTLSSSNRTPTFVYDAHGNRTSTAYPNGVTQPATLTRPRGSGASPAPTRPGRR